MTPDTAALRALAAHAETMHDNPVWLAPHTVRALCDAADEVERLAAEVERLLPCDAGCRDYPEEDCPRHGRPVSEVWQMLTEAVAANTASRTAHAALVADLREARTWLDVATDNLTDSGDGTYVAVSESLAKVRALLDRHAPEEDR